MEKDKEIKKLGSNKLLFFIALFILLLIIFSSGLIFINRFEKKVYFKETKVSVSYNVKIYEYGLYLNNLVKEHMNVYETVPTFEEIEKTKFLDITCQETIINEDGTIYLGKCKVDNLDYYNEDKVFGKVILGAEE